MFLWVCIMLHDAKDNETDMQKYTKTMIMIIIRNLFVITIKVKKKKKRKKRKVRMTIMFTGSPACWVSYYILLTFLHFQGEWNVNGAAEDIGLFVLHVFRGFWSVLTMNGYNSTEYGSWYSWVTFIFKSWKTKFLAQVKQIRTFRNMEKWKEINWVFSNFKCIFFFFFFFLERPLKVRAG